MKKNKINEKKNNEQNKSLAPEHKLIAPCLANN